VFALSFRLIQKEFEMRIMEFFISFSIFASRSVSKLKEVSKKGSSSKIETKAQQSL